MVNTATSTNGLLVRSLPAAGSELPPSSKINSGRRPSAPRSMRRSVGFAAMNRAEFAARGTAMELDEDPFTEAGGATQEPEVLDLPGLASVRLPVGGADGDTTESRGSRASLTGRVTAVPAPVGGGTFEGIGTAKVELELPGWAATRAAIEGSFGGELIELAIGGVEPRADPVTGKVSLHCGHAATFPNNSSGATSSLPQFGQRIVSGIPEDYYISNPKKK